MGILLLIIVIFSIILHECAHGFTAYKLGDPTAKLKGRLTLNPIAHTDPVGTIILPITLFLISSILWSKPLALGYAKPVPINPYHFRNPKKGLLLVGIAGPATNFIIAFLLSLLLKIGQLEIIAEVLTAAVAINLLLAIFNLIPLPPLDGSRVISVVLPRKFYYNYLKFEKFGFVIIGTLILFGFIDWFVFPILRIMLSFLGIKGII